MPWNKRIGTIKKYAASRRLTFSTGTISMSACHMVELADAPMFSPSAINDSTGRMVLFRMRIEQRR